MQAAKWRCQFKWNQPHCWKSALKKLIRRGLPFYHLICISRLPQNRSKPTCENIYITNFTLSNKMEFQWNPRTLWRGNYIKCCISDLELRYRDPNKEKMYGLRLVFISCQKSCSLNTPRCSCQRNKVFQIKCSLLHKKHLSKELTAAARELHCAKIK